MFPELVTPSQAYNLLQDDPRLLVMDSRPKNVYQKSHIRRSSCVQTCSSNKGRTLEEVAGPGSPFWTKSCWWDKNVLLVVTQEVEKAIRRKSKKREKNPESDNIVGGRWEKEEEEEERGGGKRQKLVGEDAVVEHLLKEGLIRSLKILVSDDKNSASGFALFASDYPFLVTRHTKGPAVAKYPAEIIPHFLYLGDWENATAEKRLEDLKVTHIVTAHTENLPEGQKKFSRLFFDLNDEFDADISQHFSSCNAFLKGALEDEGRVLVHCGAGVSRSATLCAAFLMWDKKWSAETAVGFLKKLRSKVQPNPGFLKALEAYEKKLKKEEGRDTTEEQPVIKKTPPHIPRIVNVDGLRFEVWKGNTLLENIPLETKAAHLIGRLPTSDIVLEHASISRQHARLSHEDGSHVFIEDLKASHGTFVDGERLKVSEKRELVEGSKVTLGASTRTFVLKGFQSAVSRWEGEADV